MIPRSRKQVGVRPRLEPLETRQLLAGDVRLNVNPSTIQIRGSNDSDAIFVTATGTELTVAGINGSTVNGKASVTVPLKNNLVIRTFGGPDEVRIDKVKLKGRMIVNTGQADDLVTIYNTTIAGTASVDGSGGSNHLGVDSTNKFTSPPVYANIKSVAESVPSLPTSQVVVRGRFDNSASQSTVYFVGSDGYRVEVPQTLIVQDSVTVGVPPLLDTRTFGNPAGIVSVQVSQVSRKGKPEGSTVLSNFPVAALPTTGLSAGTITLQALDGINSLLASAVTSYQAVQKKAGTRIDTGPLIAQIGVLSARITTLAGQVTALANGSTSSIALGNINGQAIAVDTASLALADQILLAQGLSVTGGAGGTTPLNLTALATRTPDQVIAAEIKQLTAENKPGPINNSLGRIRSAGSGSVGVGGLATQLLGTQTYDAATRQTGADVTAGYDLASVILSTFSVAQTLQSANTQLIAATSTQADYDGTISNIRNAGVDRLNGLTNANLAALESPTPANTGLQQVVAEAQRTFELAFRDDRPARLSVATQINNNYNFINTAFGGGGGGGGGSLNATNLSGIYQFTGTGAFAGTSNGNMTLTVTGQNGQNITGRANFTNLGGQNLSAVFTAVYNPALPTRNFVGNIQGILNGTDLNFAGTIIGRSISDGILNAAGGQSGTFTLGLQ